MRMTRSLSTVLLILLLSLSLLGCDLLGGVATPPAGDVNFTPTVFTEVIKDTFESTYADQLSPNEKHIYDSVAALSPGTLSVKLSFPEVPTICKGREPTDAEMEALGNHISAWAANALYAVWLDHPEIFWLDFGAYSYEYEVKGDANGVVFLSALTLKLSQAEGITDPAADRAALLAATADFAPTGSTVAQKLLYINNYLCARVDYDLKAPNRGNVIGALVGGKCVCEGYAQAFSYLCRLAGISVASVPGYGTTDEGTEGHMWSAVRIDGVTYGIDVTWNDTTGKNSYFLVGAQTECNGTKFGESHTPDMLTLEGPYKAFALPAITANAYPQIPQ